MVKSRNQAFLVLTTPLTETSVYKDSSTPKASSFILIEENYLFSLFLALKCFLGELFMQGKED